LITCWNLFARHGGFDLKLAAQGDLDVDQHHSVKMPESLWARFSTGRWATGVASFALDIFHADG